MNQEQNKQFIDDFWDKNIIPTLMEYIKIPNKSPQFDKDWQTNGYMDKATQLIAHWCQTHAIDNMQLDIVKLPNRTPVLLIEIPGSNNDTVLMYGHLDKQPEMSGWDADLNPWQPVLRGDRLYGRGSADDGYATFASLAAMKSLREQKIPHARCIILIEASEESGSPDLPYYIDALKEKIGEPSLIICLDSGCGNYNQLWVTTSLRGLLSGRLSIHVLKQGIHSGSGSGIVPSCFRILRQLLNRIENETNGEIILRDLHVDIPLERKTQAEQAAKVLGHSLLDDLPFLPHVEAESYSLSNLILRRTWQPALSVIGCDGIPIIQNAGNVTLPALSIKLSMRLPPISNPEKAADILKKTLERNPPYHAQVQFTIHELSRGWNAPMLHDWLATSIHQASLQYFGEQTVYMGEGGTIPFMGMLSKKFPQAQFFITGLLGPESNAHGPNEFIHIPTGKKLTACVAAVIADHFKKSPSIKN